MTATPEATRGFIAYAHLVGIVSNEPMTAAAAASIAGLATRSTNNTLQILVRYGWLSICDWERHGRGFLPVFGRRGLPSVAYPGPGKRFSRCFATRSGSPSVMHFHNIMHALEIGNSQQEICQETGIHVATVRLVLGVMRRFKVLSISGWTRVNVHTPYRPVYTLYGGADVPRPKLKCLNQSAREYQSRKRVKAKQMRIIGALAGTAANQSMREAA
jgi:hypothetical protein